MVSLITCNFNIIDFAFILCFFSVGTSKKRIIGMGFIRKWSSARLTMLEIKSKWVFLRTLAWWHDSFIQLNDLCDSPIDFYLSSLRNVNFSVEIREKKNCSRFSGQRNFFVFRSISCLSCAIRLIEIGSRFVWLLIAFFDPVAGQLFVYNRFQWWGLESKSVSLDSKRDAAGDINNVSWFSR